MDKFAGNVSGKISEQTSYLQMEVPSKIIYEVTYYLPANLLTNPCPWVTPEGKSAAKFGKQ